MIFALAGNQNCGKTTLFNALTGSNQHVGNFPGVTVDQKIGEIKDGKSGSVVDLPGIYSLRPYTQEEIVTSEYILHEKPDCIIKNAIRLFYSVRSFILSTAFNTIFRINCTSFSFRPTSRSSTSAFLSHPHTR